MKKLNLSLILFILTVAALFIYSNVFAVDTITVTKSAKNLRTGEEGSNTQPISVAIPGDTIEFIVTWANISVDKAETVTLVDYIPPYMTYLSGSVTDTETNCDTPGTAIYYPGENKVEYISSGVAGTVPGPAGNGVIKFRIMMQ